MTSLADLFPSGPRSEAEAASPLIHEAYEEAQMTAMLGAPRQTAARPAPEDQTERLVTMVDQVTKTAPPPVARPTARGTRERNRPRRDWLSIGLVAVAIVALAVAGVLAVAKLATATPAVEAVHVLEADERTVGNAETALAGSISQLLTDRDVEIARANAFRAAVVEIAEVADPRGVDGEMMSVIDPDTLAALLTDVDAHILALGQVQPPEAPALYERGPVDVASISDVGQAIDAAQSALNALDLVSQDVRDVRGAFTSAVQAFEGRVSAFGATFIPAASGVLEQGPDAAEEIRTALVAAAGAVEAADLTTAPGFTALRAYQEAVRVVIADQVRAEAEAEAERLRLEEEERLRQQQQQQPPSTPTPGPGTPDPTPTNPAPTDPDPTDPPEPDPTDPSEESGD